MGLPWGTIQIADDRLSAMVHLERPPDALPVTDSDGLPTSEVHAQLVENFWMMLEAELTALQITVGIDTELARAGLTQWLTDAAPRIFCIARGRAPVDGLPGTVALCYTPPSYIPLSDATVDLRERHFVPNIAADTQLARITPPTVGEPGITICGEPIPAIPGEPAAIAREGLLAEETDAAGIVSVRSEQRGILLHYTAARIAVSDTFTIAGDVDAHTGNIDVWGHVHICGSVTPHYLVHARGNITVDGNIESAFVDAAGDCLVTGGIFGNTADTQVRAEQVQTRFVQNAQILARRGDVTARDTIVNSRIQCQGNCHATQVRTCQITAGGNIQTQQIGSSGDGHARLVAGTNPTVWSQLQRMQKDLRFISRMGKMGRSRDNTGPRSFTTTLGLFRTKKRRMGAILERNIVRKDARLVKEFMGSSQQPGITASQRFYPIIDLSVGPFQEKIYDVESGGTYRADLVKRRLVKK